MREQRCISARHARCRRGLKAVQRQTCQRVNESFLDVGVITGNIYEVAA